MVAWGGTSPDGRAVTGSLGVMKTLFNPHNQDEDYAGGFLWLGSFFYKSSVLFWGSCCGIRQNNNEVYAGGLGRLQVQQRQQQ